MGSKSFFKVKLKLATIAKELNLSVATVSRALSGVPGIHPDTREKVRLTAESLGYHPGRKFDHRAKAPQLIALSCSHNPMGSQWFLSGINRTAVGHSLSLVEHFTTPAEAEKMLHPDSQPPAMRLGRINGVIILGRWPASVVRHLHEHWPVVSIVHHYPENPVDVVDADDRRGMAEILRHLHATGHRRIGFFGFCREMSWSRSRFAGFVEAQTVRDLPYDPADIVPVSLAEALEPEPFALRPETRSQLLARIGQGVDAWVGSSHGTARSLHRFCGEEGIRIPKDVAIVSYGHRTRDQDERPRFTTSAVPEEELGAAAVRRMLRKFAHPHELSRSILLPGQLIVGKTTRGQRG